MKLLVVAMVVACLLTGSVWADRDYTTNEVTITVLGADGAPVAGAKVRAWSDTWGHFAPWDRYKTTDADDNGQVKFKMIVGDWSIFAAADGLYLADVRHAVTPDTKEITVRPDSTLTLEAKDLDGAPLEDAEVHIYTAEHRPVVPMMVAGKMVGGKAEIATIGHQMYGVMLVRKPTDTTAGLVLHWDHVRDKYTFEPNKDWLRKLTIHARDLDGGPGEIEARISFPELTCVWDYRNNPGEFVLDVKEEAVLFMEPLYLEVEAVFPKDGWRLRYFPSHFDLQKESAVDVTFGGPHTIVPKAYDRENYLSATWIRMEDSYGHLMFEVRNPDDKLPPLEFNFRDKDGNRLYGDVEAGQWAPAVRFTKDLTKEVASFDGVIDYGPFGKRVFAGDPHSDEFGCNVECVKRTPHFEFMCTHDPQFALQIDAMAAWMEQVYYEYGHIWGLATYLADKPVTMYFEPNLSNAIGGLSYGNKMINAWITDLLDFTDPRRNALCHMQNIVCHEYFHTCQAMPEMKWGGRSLYPDAWIGESMPQIAMNRVYERYYGPIVAKMHQGLYLNGALKRLAGENGYGNKELVWEEVTYDFGDDVHRRVFELLGDRDWKQWDWMIKSNIDMRAALLALYEHVTGKNYAYMARLVGDTDVTDEMVDAAYAYVERTTPPYPEICKAPFVMKWLVLGSFDDKGHKFLKTEQMPDEGKLHPKAGDKLLDKEWVVFDSEREDGFVDLEVPCGVVDKAAGFAFTTVNAKQAGKAWLWYGSDDGSKVWLNGEKVLDQDFHRPADPEHYILPVDLKAGENTILIKIDEDSAWWGFYVRFTDAEGNAIVTQ
jgi:hypothetical protein